MIAPLVPLPHPLAALEAQSGLAHLQFVPHASDPGTQAANDRGPAALAMLEIDALEELVETHGQVCGSLAVLSVMRTLRAALPSLGAAVRRGRSTIEVTLPGSDLRRARRQIVQVLEKIHAQPVHYGGETVHVSVSAGIAAEREPMNDDGLKRRAEGALSEARHSGHGRVCIDFAAS